MLSLVMGIYYPLGLISAGLVRGKLLLWRLYKPGLSSGWDADMDQDEKNKWAQWFLTMLNSREIQFPRLTRPETAVGRPRVVGFCDTAEEAVCAVVSVVWQTAKGNPASRLLIAKCRVAPLLGYTIPQGELQSLVVLNRLPLTIAEAFPVRFVSLSTFTDSTSSTGAVNKSSSVLKPFFVNQMSEILSIREALKGLVDHLPPIQHVDGCLNPADMGTQGTVNIQYLGAGSTWQTGPDFLLRPFEDWTEASSSLEQDLEVPEAELRKVASASYHATVKAVKIDFAGCLRDYIVQQTELGLKIVAMVETALEREKLELSVCAVACAT